MYILYEQERHAQLKSNMEHIFIINPAAGKGKALKFITDIKSLFENLEYDYSIKITEKPGHATEIAREYTQRKDCRIYSVGGDGTLNEVLNGMAGSNSSLAILPAGSGNDFIKSITSNLDLKDILFRTVNGTERLIDLAKVNGQYFINISSIGFDAEVANKVYKIKKIPLISGSLAYILGIIIMLIKYNNNYIKVDIDGKLIETKSLLVAVANGRYYGGGMKPAPDAEIDDGLLDVCLIKEVKRGRILRFLPLFKKGLHETLPEVSIYNGKQIIIECEKELAINADGEVGITKRALFEIIPNAIKVIVPN